ncbi:MAG: LysM peptidoglycan-binding domain-containing protein, partial [Alcanivoracaceae bacterium]|nr:LysM peptidoglycan-binding domain-containing protein [Alcanivoracaceae bacterium]
ATALNTGANGGDITVTGSVDSDAGNSWALDLTAGTGNIDLQSAVGATDALASLTVNSATTARFGGDVTTDGTQDVTAGTIQTNGTHATTDSAISLTGAVALQSATALNSGANAGDITVIGDVDGAQTLAITAGTGNVDVQGTVGGGAPLTSLTINSAADTNLDAVTAGTITQVAGTGVTTLDGVLTSTTGDINITSDQIVQNAAITSFAEVLLEATQDIALNTGAVTAGSRLIHLIASSGVLQDAANHGGLNADDLLLEGGGDFILVTDAANNLISNVATVGTVAGTVRFENDDALGLTVATVNDAAATPNSGVVANAVEISASVGNLTVDQPTQATAGDLLLESQAGGITIRQAVTGSADVSVKAFAGVAQATADGDISAGADLYVASTNGGTLNMVDGATSSAADTLVYEVVSGNGDLLLGGLSATTVLVTGVDDIVDNGDTDVDITATDVVLDSNSIGQVDMVAAADDAIETTIGTLHFTALSGSAAVSDSGTLVLADVSVPAYQVLNFAAAPTTVGATGYSGGSTANIHAVIQAATALTVEDGLVASNNILLSAANGDLAINNAVTSTGGSVELAASDNVTQAADGDVTASGGTLRVSAGTGDITMTDGAVGSASGNVAYAAANDVTVASISGANVSVNAGGDILDGGDAATDILATNVNLQAGGDIGETSDALDTSVSTLAASATSGGIYINESDGLIVDDVAAFNVNQIGLDGGNTPTPATTGLAGTSAGTNVVFDVSGAGDLTIGHQILNLEGNVLLRTFDGTLTINDQILSFTSAANGHVSVVAGDDDGSGDNGVFQGANGNILAEGSIDVYSDNGITMADDAVAQAAGTSAGANAGHLSYQTAAGAFDITVGQLNANQVYVNAGQDILDGGDTDRDIFGGGPGSGVILEAGRDIGENANPLETTMLLFSASATDGGVYISESDGVVVDTITAFDINRIGLDGAIGSTLSSGSLAGTTAGTNVIIDVTGAGSLSVNSGHSITTDDGNILLQTFDGGISLGGLLDANTTGANGHVSILLGDDGGSADHTFNQGPDGDITADGSVDVYSANAISMADGAVTTSTGTSTNVNAGNIAYQTASGAFDIALGQLNGSDVLVNAGGSIIDNGDANTDIVADNLQLEAGTNIGQADGIGNGLIDIEAVTLAADAGGDIFVDEVTDALIIDIVGVIGVERVATDATTATQSSTAFLVDAANAGSDLFVRTAGGLTVNGSVSATDQLLLDVQGGDLALNNTVTAGGNASLLASGAIDQNAGADVVVGGTLDVDAQGGAITMADGTVSTVTGNIHYLATGNILLSSLSGADVLVDAGGSIIDNGDADVDVIATNAQLRAGASIGEPDGTNNGPIDTTVTGLAASAGTGSIWVSETDDLVIDDLATIDVLRVNLDNTTTNQVGGTLAGATAAQDLAIEAGGAILVDVDAPVDATAGDLLLDAQGGNLSLQATVNAGANASLLTSADLLQGSLGDVTAGGTVDADAAGAIDMTDGATTVATGNVRYLAAGNILVGSLSGDNVRVESTAGSIVDNGETDVDIIATTAQLQAQNSIGEPNASNNGLLETTVGTLGALANTGGIYIDESDALVIGSVPAIDVLRVGINDTAINQPGGVLAGAFAGDDVIIRTNGDLTVDNGVTAIAGDMLLRSQTGNMQLNAAVTATAGNATIDVVSGTLGQSADGDISAGGDIYVDANGAITMDDGAVSNATGNLFYGSGADLLIASLVASDVLVDVTGSITDNGETDVDVVAITTQLRAGASIGEADGTNNGPLETTVTTLAATAGTGNIYVSETDALDIGSVAAIDVNSVGLNAGSSLNTGALLEGAVAAQNLKVETVNGGLTVSNAVDATAADLLLDAQNGDLTINATVDAGGNASLLASANVTQSAAGDVTVGGTLDVNAQGGDIDMTDGAVSTATGNIRYLASNDVLLGSLSGADVRVDAGNDIIDNGETDVDVIATNAQLVAGNSIGEISGTNNGPVETTVGVLAAEATAGNVYLFESDDLEIGSVAAIDVLRVGIDSSAINQPGSQLDGILAQLEIDVEADDLLITQEVRSVAGNILLTARNGAITQNGATAAQPELNQIIAVAGNVEMDATNGNILLQRVSADGNTVTLTTTDQILNNNLDALDAGLAGAVNVIADTLIASADDTIGLTAAGQFTDPSNEQRLITEVENDIQVFLAQAGTVGIDNTSTDGEVDVVFNLPLADVSNGSSVWVRTSEAMRALGLEFATESNAVEFNGNVQLLAVDGDLTLNEAQVGDANDVNLVAQWMRLSAPRGAFLNGDGSRFLNVGDGLVLTADDLVIVTGGDLGVEATVDRIDITGTGLYQVAPGGTPGTGGENADLNIQLSKRDIAVVDDPILFESIIITRPASDGVPTWITDLDAFYPYVFDENNYGLFSTGTASAISLRQDDGVNTTHDGSINFPSNVNVGALSSALDLTLEVRAGQFNTTEYAGTVYVLPGVNVLAENIGTPDTGTLSAFGNVLVDGNVFAREDRSIEAPGRGGDIIIDSDTSAAGRVVLSPGQGFDVIFTNAATFRVSQGVSAEGDLVILSARNVLMDPDTAILADGSVLIGADNITGSVVEATGIDAVEGDIVLYDVTANANGNGIGDIVVYTNGGRSGETYTFDGPAGPTTYTVTGSITLGRQDVLDDLLANLALDPNFLDTPANVPVPALQAVNVKLFAHDSIDSGWSVDYAAGDLTPDQELTHVVADKTMVLYALNGTVGGTSQIALDANLAPAQQALRVDVGDLMSIGAGSLDAYGVSAHLVGNAQRLQELLYVPGLIVFNKWAVGGAIQPKFVSGTSIDAINYQMLDFAPLSVSTQQALLVNAHGTHNAVWDANMEAGQPMPVQAMWIAEGGGISGGVNVLLDPAVVGDNWTFRSYAVVSGDTLWDIAEKYLGDPLRWPEIWWLTEGISDPDVIEPGQEIHLEAEDIRRLKALQAEEEEAAAKAEAEARAAAEAEGVAL